MAKKSKAQLKREQQEEQKQWITIVILFAFIILGLTRSGMIGVFLFNMQRYLLGSFFWLIFGILIVMVFMNMLNRHHGNEEKNPAPFILIIMGILLICTYSNTDKAGMDVFLHYISDIQAYFSAEALNMNPGGGIAGGLLYGICSMLFGRQGVILVIVVLFAIAAILLVSLNVYKDAFHHIGSFFAIPEKEEEEAEQEPEEEKPSKNLWLMLDDHKKKKEEKKTLAGSINVDEPEEEKDDSDILTENKKEPHVTSLFNIQADGKTQEIPVVSIPGKTVSDDKSPFIDVDDLVDNIDQEASEDMDTQQLDFSEDEEKEEPEEEETVTEEEKPAVTETKKPETPKYITRPYHVPSMRTISQMLDPLPNDDANAENEAAAREKGELLINILKNFDIQAKLLQTHIGPAVTQFEIKPDASVKVSRILGLADNIKMALAAKDVRIEAPIPGRNAVGIEIPNQKSTPVKMRELMNGVSEKDKKQPLLFFLGKDLLGQTVTCRLDKMPHLLIAGATGSGKSVCMNAIICSLLLRTDPDDVKMLLVDPKKVEFTPYQRIPHLIGPVINDPAKANNALKAIVQIMDERYNMFAAAGCRNIQSYNEKVRRQNGAKNPDGSPAPVKMPYIVVIIDELADLMAVAGKEVEQSIQRITQLARAAGIHLIVATQRPSVDVITGIIKANIPSRIAFAVSSGTDSRTILDHVGAERLLGNGDMLYMPIGQSGATRVQGVFVTDDEVKCITDWVSARGIPKYDDKFVLLEGINDGEGGAGGVVGVSEDPMFQEVKKYVIEAQKASTSLLQRRFGIGYNRAARMIDALEQEGVIGPAQGSKPRDVFIKPDKKQKKTETGEIIDD
ncbi:MAG: DNA translocase FtsK [Erysipelotrichaceae bacterium]|nr:DNA translocase FtsK [Erysipelotrichaceae bacterium]